MPQLLSRESIFDAACFLAGKIGKIFGVRLNHPVLLVGTGRCGTSLLVKILNSHPGLSGFPGEANELWHPKLEPFESASLNVPPIELDPKRFTEISISNWPPKHGEKIRDIFTGFYMIKGLSKTFFAKSAMISFMIPEILEVFPDVRIIHIYRSGPSVVESYFKKNFGKYSRYSYAEKDYRLYCAKYWNDCILEIEKRRRELSLTEKGQFFELSYESLCERPNAILDDIARFIGVASDGFGFDISQISSQNKKVGDYSNDPKWVELQEVMAPGMKLKGYDPTRFHI